MWKQPECLWADKQNVAYTCNGILFSPKKEWSSDTCYNMDKHEAILREISHSWKTNTVCFHLHEILKIVQNYRDIK